MAKKQKDLSGDWVVPECQHEPRATKILDRGRVVLECVKCYTLDVEPGVIIA